MFQVNSLLFCVILHSASLLDANEGDYNNIYIKLFRCNPSDKFVYKNYSCFAKTFNRKLSTINVYARAKIPLYNITVSHVQLHCEFLIKFELCRRDMRYFISSMAQFIDKLFVHQR